MNLREGNLTADAGAGAPCAFLARVSPSYYLGDRLRIPSATTVPSSPDLVRLVATAADRPAIGDQTHDGRKHHTLNVIDEFTHEVLAI